MSEPSKRSRIPKYKILATLLVILVGLYLFRAPIGRGLLLGYLEAKTGLVVQAGKVSATGGIRYLALDDVVFRDKSTLEPMLRIGHVNADVGFMGLIRRPMRLNRLEVEVDYLNLQRDTRGKTRLASSDGVSKPEQEPRLATPAPAPKKKVEAPEADEEEIQFVLDEIQIKVNRVVYKDYSMGSTPMEMKLTLNLEREYQDVTSTDDLAKRISEDLLGTLLGGGTTKLFDL